MSKIENPNPDLENQTPQVKESEIYNNAQKDSSFVTEQTQSYLTEAPDENALQRQITKQAVNASIVINVFLKTISVDSFQANNLENVLQSFEKLRDANTGIAWTERKGKDDIPPVMIRDARLAKDPQVRGTEAFKMQQISMTAAAIDLIENSTISPEDKTAQKQALVEKCKLDIAKLDAVEQNAKAKLGKKERSAEEQKQDQDKIQKKLSKTLRENNESLTKVLKKYDIEPAMKKLNTAKDYQNFKYTNYNLVTLTQARNDRQDNIIAIEAEVGMRGITEKQKADYEKIKNYTEQKCSLKDMPQWYQNLDSYEQILVNQNIEALIAGKRQSTQLRSSLPGLKNAFEKITSVCDMNDSEKQIEELEREKHSGTMASVTKEGAVDVTLDNLEQAQEWAGKDCTLSINSLNTGAILSFEGITAQIYKSIAKTKNDDVTIVKRFTEAQKDQKLEFLYTNTAMNKFKNIDGANVYSGAYKLIKDANEYLEAKQNPKSHDDRELQNKITSLKELVDQNTENQKAEGAYTLMNQLISAHNNEKKMIFQDNRNLLISQQMSEICKIQNKIIQQNQQDKTQSFFKKIVHIIMCASGKDRTGVRMHERSVDVIAKYLLERDRKRKQSNQTKQEILNQQAKCFHEASGKSQDIDVQENGHTLENIKKDLYHKMILGGHTASQAGSIIAGGATIGCFGIIKNGLQSLHANYRKAGIGNELFEITSETNKIKKLTYTHKVKKQVKEAVKTIKSSSQLAYLKTQSSKVVNFTSKKTLSLLTNNDSKMSIL